MGSWSLEAVWSFASIGNLLCCLDLVFVLLLISFECFSEGGAIVIGLDDACCVVAVGTWILYCTYTSD